jgi:hypothetical protein
MNILDRFWNWFDNYFKIKTIKYLTGKNYEQRK